MEGVYLKFYVTQGKKHKGVPLYEWILEEAKKLGCPGGSAFIALASYGHEGKFREEHFFELGGTQTIELVFALSEEQAHQLFAFLKKENLNLFYIKSRAEYGFLNNSSNSPS